MYDPPAVTRVLTLGEDDLHQCIGPLVKLHYVFLL